MTDWIRASSSDAHDHVEVAFTDDGHTLVRQTRRPSQVLRFNAAEWVAFLTGVSNGEFNAPTERTRR